MTQDFVKSMTLAECQHYLTPRSQETHKGDYGHVLVIGGDFGMSGAVRLAAEAALRSGAGVVSIATRPEHALILAAMYPELMCYGIKQAEDCLPLLVRATVIVIGPGLGQSSWGENLLRATLDCVNSQYRIEEDVEGNIEKKLNSERSLIMDADALNLLSQSPSIRESLLVQKQRKNNWMITPHPAEAARLLGCSTSEVQADRVQAIQALYKHYQGVVVLKGSGTLTLGSSQIIKRCAAGNPGMATAGMGDVLTGIIAGLVAQNMSLEQAANLGVCAHAAAADQVAYQYGQRGMNARDILGPLRQCLNPVK